MAARFFRARPQPKAALASRASLGLRAGQPGRPIVGLERPHQPAGLHETQLERAGQAPNRCLVGGVEPADQCALFDL